MTPSIENESSADYRPQANTGSRPSGKAESGSTARLRRVIEPHLREVHRPSLGPCEG